MLLPPGGFMKVTEDAQTRARRAPDHDVRERIELPERPDRLQRAPHAGV
jgi:hypothetical protein